MKMTTILNDRYQQDEVLSAILSADSVLLFAHVSPDGDTLGSALAMKLRLERMGKRAQVIIDGAVPSRLAFLPGAQQVLSFPAQPQPFDLALAIDVSSRDRMGKCEELFFSCEKTAVVDHHGTNAGFGQYNMIDGDAPACAVVVFRLFQRMDMPLMQDEAICLYTALSTDTGNFIYESTNAESFAMMSALMDAGLPLADCGRVLFRKKEVPHVRLLAQALPSLRILANGKVAGLRLTQEQLRLAGADNGHAEGIVDYAIDLFGVSAAYFLREAADGKTKVSLRALEPYAVDGIAARLGGGGHRLAAGITLDMPLDQAVELIEQALCEAVV